MATVATCRACQSPVQLGMHYCAACLLSPAFRQASEPVPFTGTLQLGVCIDRFQIVESLGEGGFSEVYSVRDSKSPHRPPLAMKVMRMGLNSTEFLSRFEQEHLVLRRLQDPGIVRVFESGINHDGRPYFVMEQVDGLRITDYCQSEQLSLESRVELFIKVCRAIHHAHQKGIIHRDLKPANILVSDQDGVSVPCVIDFGLATAVECWNAPTMMEPSAAWVTRLGVTMGTPGYISPEQADGCEDTDTLSDVFSLGTVLYELIAQCPPWPHETWKQLPHSKWAQHKCEHTPLKPSMIGAVYASGRRIDDDLDTICSKALATDRTQRYESVSQLATDLVQWLKGDAISARPPSLTYRIRKLMSRYRWQSATLIATLLACLLSAVFGLSLAIRERRYSAKLAVERTAAIDAQFHATLLSELADRERTVAQRAAYASSLTLATSQIASGQPFLARQNLNATQSSQRGWEWGYLQKLLPKPILSIATNMEGSLSLAVSPNHRFAVLCDGRSISRLDLQQAAQSKPCKVNDRVQHVAISDDGQFIATLTHQPTSSSINVYRYSTSKSDEESAGLAELWSIPIYQDASLGFQTGNESLLIVVEGNGSEPTPWNVRRFNAATGETLAQIGLKRWKLADKGLLIGKSFAAVRCCFDRLAVLRLSDFTIAGYIYGESNALIADFEFNTEETKVVFAQNGSVLEAKWDQADQDVTDLESNKRLKVKFEIDTHCGGVHRINRNPENQWMAITDTHCVVEGSEPVRLPVKIETQFVSLLDDTFATILPQGIFEIRREFEEPVENQFAGRSAPPESEARRVVVSPSSKFCLYQIWSRQNIYRCSLLDDSAPSIFETPANPKLEWSRLPIFDADGTAIISTLPTPLGDGRTSELATLHWDHESPQCHPLPIDTSPWSAAFSPDHCWLFVGSTRGVSALSWPGRELVKEWPLDHGPFVVMPAADSARVFALGCDHIVHQLRLDAAAIVSNRTIEERIAPIPAHSDFLEAEQVLAIAGPNGVGLFTLGSGHAKLDWIPAEASVTSIRFSIDGKRLAIAMANRKIAIWDWMGKHRLIELPTRGTCSSIDFSNDGRWLVNTDYDLSLTIR